MAFGQQPPVVPGVFDQPTGGLDQPQTKRVSAAAAIGIAVSSAWRDVMICFAAIEGLMGGRFALPSLNTTLRPPVWAAPDRLM
jgi:hypothetical protein